MIFSAVTSQLATCVLAFGWPAYHSFKATSLGSNELLKEWLKYWIILAMFLALQSITDMALFWLPLYYDAKVAFVVMLWHPKSKGAVYLYDQYLQPLMRSHEATIDKQIAETKARALDYCNMSMNRARQYALQHTSSFVEHIKHFSEQAPAMPKAAASHQHTD